MCGPNVHYQDETQKEKMWDKRKEREDKRRRHSSFPALNAVVFMLRNSQICRLVAAVDNDVWHCKICWGTALFLDRLPLHSTEKGSKKK